MTTNPEVIANSFNDFFVNVGKNLAENIKSDIDPLKYIANNLRSINTIQVTEDKILSIISAMKNSAPGFDELPAFLMKQCSKLLIKPLCHVLSLSIRQGVFPTVGNTTVFHGRYSLFHTVGSIRWHSPHVFSSCVTRMSRYVANDN